MRMDFSRSLSLSFFLRDLLTKRNCQGSWLIDRIIWARGEKDKKRGEAQHSLFFLKAKGVGDKPYPKHLQDF
jgi:hypothetical protein